MSDTTQSDTAQPGTTAIGAERGELNPEAGLGGAAAFASAESIEILNLLGDQESGGSCCGGGCCS